MMDTLMVSAEKFAPMKSLYYRKDVETIYCIVLKENSGFDMIHDLEDYVITDLSCVTLA